MSGSVSGKKPASNHPVSIAAPCKSGTHPIVDTTRGWCPLCQQYTDVPVATETSGHLYCLKCDPDQTKGRHR